MKKKNKTATEQLENVPKQLREHAFKKGESGNPNGRPRGTLSFKTKFYQAMEKISKETGATVDELEKQLILSAYKEARKGDFQFYKDILDRIYGKAQQSIDISANITNEPQITEEQRAVLDKLMSDE